jgi:xanthine dehydrogenase accessory factor
MPPECLRRVHAPIGLDIGAVSPEEIAVSVLAEIVKIRANAAKTAAQPKAGPVLPVINNDAKDPVCGMTVNKSKAKYQTYYQGTAFYFCCAGCKLTFEHSPQRYLVSANM